MSFCDPGMNIICGILRVSWFCLQDMLLVEEAIGNEVEVLSCNPAMGVHHLQVGLRGLMNSR